MLLVAGHSALAGTIARPTPPDPLLDGGPVPGMGPCAGLAAGMDYAAGTDASGNPVIPADVGAPPVPVPDGIAIPLGRTQAQGQRQGRQQAHNPVTGRGEGAYVNLDGARLAPLLTPPSCPKPSRR